MIQCVICNKEFKSNLALGCHVKLHNLTSEEYKEKFNLIKKCETCGKKLLKNNKSGFCNEHIDKSGENNAFYGKTHSDKTKLRLSERCSITSKKMWEDDEYRNKVINAVTGLKRTDEFKEKQRKNAKEQMKDPKQLELRSIAMTKSWNQGLIPNSDNYAINRSKGEKELFEILSSLYDNVSTNTIKLENGKYIFPDIVINNKVIIEYFGNYWHCNPDMYDKDFIISRSKTKAEDVWNRDSERIKIIEKLGYTVFIIWEKDYKENKENTLTNLKEKINKCLKLK